MLCTRLQTPRSWWARRLCTILSDFAGVLDDPNHRVRESRIASNTAPMPLDTWFNTSSLSIHDRLRHQSAAFYFRRRQDIMRRMRAEAAVPFSVCIKATLDCANARHQTRTPRPRLEISEDPLDLRVELPSVDMAPDVCDPSSTIA